MTLLNRTLAVVIPAYRAAGTIEAVLARIPDYVDWIIVVNDASPDDLDGVLARYPDARVETIVHPVNRGVGGAMASGFKRALERGADLAAKVDADGQMDPGVLDRFVRLAVRFDCDYVKANRFGHLEALPAMPLTRLVGNVGLTFLTKLASGYWNLFDPQNGYVMITREMLRRLDLDRLDESYFFENSMLIHLNVLGARIGEIYLPARYMGEVSSLRPGLILRTFPIKLIQGYWYRVVQKYLFRTVSPYALLLGFGLLAMLWGAVWGGVAWARSIATGVPSTTGTVILALLPLLLGWTSLLQALVLDVTSAGPSILFDYDDLVLQPGSDEGICQRADAGD
jgi:glycosyltransferase involved in cell wall biosynthesis